jgi:hypothetical protein
MAKGDKHSRDSDRREGITATVESQSLHSNPTLQDSRQHSNPAESAFFCEITKNVATGMNAKLITST